MITMASINERKFRGWMIRSCSLLAISIVVFISSGVAEGQGARPFWAGKISYIEGDTLFAVGSISNAKSLEAGRQIAQRRAVREIRNFVKITDLSGIKTNEGITYWEANSDNSFNVYRLLEIDMVELGKWKATLLSRATEQLKEYNDEIEIQIEKKEREIKRLERQAAELAILDFRASNIEAGIGQLNQEVKKQARCGMTMTEVEKILDKPRTVDNSHLDIGMVHWNYGKKWLTFNNGTVVSIADNQPTPFEGKGCTE